MSGARPPLALVPTFFGCLVFDRRSSRYMPFDRRCAALLDALCDAPIDVVREAAPSADRAALEAFYAHFLDAGFFGFDGQLAAARVALPEPPPPDCLPGPLALHLEIVARCNLRCSHCFAGELPRRRERRPTLTLDEIDGLCAELASIGCFRLGLSGGEPLLRPDLLEIIDCATGHGLHPCLTTNALLLDERMARELGRRDLCWLNVSLEGPDAPSNDAVRGAGTFERVLDKVRLLAEHARFSLAFTITRQNAALVGRCAELAHAVGAHTAVFRPLYPVGVAQGSLDALMPSYDDYAGALERLAAGATRTTAAADSDDAEDSAAHELRVVDPFSPAARAPRQARTFVGGGCGAANLVASVSATGDVNPCSFLGAAFDSGNIRDRPLRHIWRDGARFVAMRASGRRSQRDGDDARFESGCRARALVLAGDADARDPWQDAFEARV